MEEEVPSSPEGSGTQEYEALELDALVHRLGEKEEKLHLAGEYGQKLLEELAKSNRVMEQLRLEHDSNMEGMIQQNFNLKKQLISLEKSLEDQKQISKQTAKDHDISCERFQSESSQELYALKAANTAKVAELEKVLLRESFLKEDIVKLEEKVASLTAEKQSKREDVNRSCSEEMFILNEKVFELENDLECASAEIVRQKNEKEEYVLAYQTNQKAYEEVRSELEESEIRNTGVVNHLQKSREETSELKVELDALKNEMKQKGHSHKGNSLFSEVEDERIVMERKLKTMEVRNESLEKAYGYLQSQHHNLKSQVTALLSLHSTKADADHITNLKRALSQAKSEINELVGKLKHSESSSTDTNDIKEKGKHLPDFETNKEMINFLTVQLNEEKSQKKKLKAELEEVYMCKMAESDKLNTAEQKLHDTGVIGEKYKNENMKLRLRLEETKSKLQAETEKRTLIEKKFNYDSSNDVVPIGIPKERKAHSPLPFTLANAAEQKETKAKSSRKHLTEKDPSQRNRPNSKLPDLDLQQVCAKIREDRKKAAAENCTQVNVKPEKDRKVSFKDVNDDPKTEVGNKIQNDKTADSCETEAKTCLKKSTSGDKIVKENSMYGPKPKRNFEWKTDNDPDCKTQ